MERRELEEIERFFASLGHRTPLAYYGLAEDASPETIDSALKKRRTWAQGQQANPKYRTEALFLIKSNANLRKLLIDERELYNETFSGADQKLAELNVFINTTLAAGGWTAAAEATIRVVGARLQLDEAVVEARIQAIARDLNLARLGDADLAALGSADIYQLLEAAPTASAAELEAAYRGRYRWARTLKDTEKSTQILASLDAAWRIVRDPERRATYDAERGSSVSEMTEEADRREADTREAEIGSNRIAELLLQNSLAPEPAPRANPPPLSMPPLSMPAPYSAAPPVAPSPPPVAPSPPPFVPTPSPSPVVSRLSPAAPEPTAPPLRLSGEADIPVPNIAGRTIGLAAGPQKLRERAPKLAVGVKSAVRLHLPRTRTVTWMLRVENAGAGKMPGHLVVDVPWIVPTRDALDPVAREQEIAIELRPKQLGGNSGVGTLTVVTDHGERRVVHFEVTRANLVAPLAGAFLVVLVGAAGLYAWQEWQAAHAPGPAAVLHLKIAPAAEHVLVNGADLGSGAALDITPPAIGQPFRVVIQAAGYVSHEEMVTVGDRPMSRSVVLKPAAP